MDNNPIDEPVVAYFDGLCEPINPGGYACGGFFVPAHTFFMNTCFGGRKFFVHGDGATNNIAEYHAALFALEKLWCYGRRGPVILRGDSQLVVYQFSGKYKINSPLLKPFLYRLHKAADCFGGLILEWVPRDQNQDADAQSRLAYQETTGRIAPIRHH